MALKEQKADINKWFNYRWIIRNLPFFIYLSVLALLYIANGHYADNTVREINLTKKNLKEQEYEYKMLNGKLMFQNRQTEISKSVASIGLQESVAQPILLKDSTIQK
ncbi:MAG: hypothetical protein KGP35_07955 [Bacteroidetes bacterium]|nr:hypothetical protein [Bacteroidota bacterium]